MNRAYGTHKYGPQDEFSGTLVSEILNSKFPVHPEIVMRWLALLARLVMTFRVTGTNHCIGPTPSPSIYS